MPPVPPGGLEPPSPGVKARRSISLSYGGLVPLEGIEPPSSGSKPEMLSVAPQRHSWFRSKQACCESLAAADSVRLRSQLCGLAAALTTRIDRACRSIRCTGGRGIFPLPNPLSVPPAGFEPVKLWSESGNRRPYDGCSPCARGCSPAWLPADWYLLQDSNLHRRGRSPML